MSNPPPSDSEATSRLTPEVVEDDIALGEAVDSVVYANVDARERMYEIARYAESLRAILDEGTWRLFMIYDEESNARFAELLLTVTRWAFEAGRQHPLSIIGEPES